MPLLAAILQTPKSAKCIIGSVTAKVSRSHVWNTCSYGVFALTGENLAFAAMFSQPLGVRRIDRSAASLALVLSVQML